MRNVRVCSLVLFLIVCWSGTASAVVGAQSVSPIGVTSPQPGEWLAAGGSHSIAWNYLGRYPLAKCSLFYSTKPRANWVFIGATTGGITSMKWAMPGNVACDSTLLKIKTIDSTGAFGLGFSGIFRIIDTIAPVVKVAPFSAKKIGPGSELEIKWSASDAIGVQSFWVFSSTKKSEWTLISSLPPTESKYAWPVPEAPCSTNYFLIVATDKAGNSGVGYSDAFRIGKSLDVIPADSVVLSSGDYLSYSLVFDTVGNDKPKDLSITAKPSWNVALVGNLLIGGPVVKPGVDTIRVAYKMKGQGQTFALRVIVPAPTARVVRQGPVTDAAMRIVSTSDKVTFSILERQSSNYALAIYDCSGRRLWSFKNAGQKDAPLSISCPVELKNGVYWASITTPAQTSRRAFRVLQ